MECNKDEATRAKEIAEMRFYEKDYAGAKKFALKALNLFPALEGLSQFLTSLDVYIAAENKINGEMDWYGILGLAPFANEETVRKQYRNRALILHPDKNNSPGAENAFKLVSEAWSLLSDKVKRLAYNQNMISKGFQHNAPNHVGSQSMASNSNDFVNLNKNATSSNDASTYPSSIPPCYTRDGTFWTTCDGCGTHFEYLRIYLNHTLRCHACGQLFVAIDKGPPTHIFKPSDWSSQQHPQKSSQQNPNVGRNHPVNPGRTGVVSQNLQSSCPTGISFNNTNIQWSPQTRIDSFVIKDGSTSVATVANVKQQPSETKEGEGIPSMAALEKSHMHKKSDGPYSNVENPMKKIRTHLTTGTATKDNRVRELAPFEIRNMLIGKAQTKIRQKLQEWGSMAEAKTTNQEEGNKGQKSAFHDKTSVEKHGSSTGNGNRHVGSILVKSNDTMKKSPDYVTINVPDPDFHNFDLDRTENSFAEDQVWAAYDDDDGMPRFYAKIQKMVSKTPFRMRISWLNSRSNDELGPMDWVGSGYIKTCGDFRPGKQEITESLNCFSHKVRWTKGARGVVRIFPGKGEVWALYRNWSPDWNENTSDEVIHMYDMVEVLEDFNEEEGVLVTPLVKVDGFKTVFQRQSNDQARKIPKVELFRFSHQVPNYYLTGQEAHNAPKGCRELDPAANSLDLHQTGVEANNLVDNIGKMIEDTFLGSPNKQVDADKGGENVSKPYIANTLSKDGKQVNSDS